MLAQKKLYKKDILLNTYKIYKIGKRVALEGKYLLTKEDILKIVQNLKKEN